MLNPTLDTLRLLGMAKALEAPLLDPDRAGLPFEDRLALRVDREAVERQNAALAQRLRSARLRPAACLEDLDQHTPRGLDRALIGTLADGAWLAQHRNLLILGPTGIGNSWIACAIGNQVARHGHAVLYQRLPRLLDDLAVASR